VGKIFLLALLALIAGLAIPTTRPRILEQVEPVLYPIHKWRNTSEMDQIARELAAFERTYYRLPTTRAGFGKWMEGQFATESSVDSWGTPYELRVWPDSFAIVSGGLDATIDSPDDIRFVQLRLAARANANSRK